MKVNFSASRPNSPYGVSRNSSVGKYQGSGLPAKYGKRHFSPSYSFPVDKKIKKGVPPLKMN